MVPLDTPEKMAKMLMAVGYPREQVRATVEAEFPGRTDYDLIITQAEEHKAIVEQQIDDAIHREGQAAVAAEHDLERTMHDG